MHRYLLIFVSFLTPALAQTLDDASLSGDYHFVHLMLNSDDNGAIVLARSQGGTISFDGVGGFTYTGRLGVGAAAATPVAGAGQYGVEPSGFVSMTNPSNDVLRLNARIADGGMVMVGASTFDRTGDAYDVFYAIQAGSGTSVTTLNGEYTGSMLGLPGGTDASIRSALIGMSAGGDGAFPAVSVLGHARDVEAGVVARQTIVGATYVVNGDGTGTAQLGGDAPLYSGPKEIFVSADGNYLLAFSIEPGAREIMTAVRNFGTNTRDADWNDVFYFAEATITPGELLHQAGVGSYNVTGDGFLRFSERTRFANFELDWSGLNFYIIRQDSTGRIGGGGAETTNMAVGVNRGGGPVAYVYSQLAAEGQTSGRYSMMMGARIPDFPGGEPFLSPVGVTHAGSFAPPTYPISPGQIVSLFGVGMAPQTTAAASLPLPTMLDGVTVSINGLPAPLFFTSNQQINAQVPFGVTGDTVSVVVDNNGVQSLAASVPLAETSPGLFTALQNGIGLAIVTHDDFSLVTPDNPATRGETVIFFLTGLGAVTPPVEDGVAVEGIHRAVDEQNIYVRFNNGPDGMTVFAGASPGFVGLYQANITIPEDATLGDFVPIFIGSGNAISDFADISIGL